jgi:hypothetical protein
MVVPAGGSEPRVIHDFAPGILDGLIAINSGDYLISSWAGGGIFRFTGNRVRALVRNDFSSPAAIGLDRRRGRVMVPLFHLNRIEVISLGASAR